MDFASAQTYLNQLTNYEHKTFPRTALKVKRLRLLKLCADSLNINLSRNFIHIGGSNGKGSVTAYLAFLLGRAEPAGAYFSPHYYCLRERIRCIYRPRRGFFSGMISGGDFAKLSTKVKGKIQKEKITLSYFEFLTILAFLYFQNKKTAVNVVETGLGGRLDATNIINAKIAVITSLDYEHTQVLGKKLAEIAREKAGIVKPKSLLITGKLPFSAKEEVRKKAIAAKAQTFVWGKDFFAGNFRYKKTSLAFDFSFGGFRMDNIVLPWGTFAHAYNFSLSLAAYYLACKKHGIALKENSVAWAAKLKLPLHFEIACCKPLVVIDGAHTPQAVENLREAIKAYFPGRKIILLFGAFTDKKIKLMLENIQFSQIILTKIKHPRAEDPCRIKDKLKLKNSFVAYSLEEAVRKSLQLASSHDVIAVCGSFYLAARAKTIFCKIINKNGQ